MFDTVEKLENTIAEFFGAPYAVAVDCCTHGIELCLRYQKIKKSSCPARTYLSIPMTFHKLGIEYKFIDYAWHDYYYIGDTNIIDAAVLWKKHSYVPGTFMCISFQFKKHLSLGRGGLILLDDITALHVLKKMSYDGRLPTQPWSEQDIDTIGYHYYMTPETAELGLKKFEEVKDLNSKKWSSEDYPDLRIMKVFNV